MDSAGLWVPFTLAGMVGGLCSSAPIGPINIWVANTVLARRQRGLVAFLAGVIIVDMIYAGVAGWGHAALLRGDAGGVLGLAAGLFLILLGMVNLRQSSAANRGEPPGEAPGPWRVFLLGAFLCGANPAFLMFWVFLLDTLTGLLAAGFSAVYSAAFLLGVLVGDVLWFAFLVKLVSRGRQAVTSVVLKRIRIGLAWGFLTAGLYYTGDNAVALW